ncbi:MAG TPA: response regulator transcription factor [Bacteroidota bacterium]|nr:response regulator transcription factor [Bacteroidota bacterium]
MKRTVRRQASHKGSRKAVWVVEDNAPFRRNLAMLLNDSDAFECQSTFSRCEDAIDALRLGSAPSVILLDIGLPGMDGVEGVKLLKQLAPECQVVILTVYDDDDHVFNAICAGASGYLLKASFEGTIVGAVNEVLSGGAPMNGQIARKVLAMFAHRNAPRADYQLTAREKEILDLVVDGMTKKKIADTLFVSYHTVDSHIRAIYQKLHVHTRSLAVAKALRERIL